MMHRCHPYFPKRVYNKQHRFHTIFRSPVKKNAKAYLNPNKFDGLTYYVYAYHDNNTTAEIETRDYGRVKIYIYNTCAEITIDKPIYQSGNY